MKTLAQVTSVAVVFARQRVLPVKSFLSGAPLLACCGRLAALPPLRRILAFLLFALAWSQVFAFQAAEYFPLTDGANWTYQVTENGQTTIQYNQILPGSVVINGVSTKTMWFSSGELDQLTNDAYGIRFHSSTAYVPGAGQVTITLSPPEVLMNADAMLSGPITTHSNVFISAPALGTGSLAQTAISTPIGIETITVPAGTFNALRVDETTFANGTLFGTPVSTYNITSTWLVKGLGAVKKVDFDATDGTSIVSSLVSSNLVDSVPDPLTFISVFGLPTYTTVTSNAVTITGVTALIPISITGGSYSINGGPYTSVAGSGKAGDTLTVQVMSGAPGETRSAALTVGGINATFQVKAALTAPLPVTASLRGDFGGDGRSDVLWRGPNGQVGIWSTGDIPIAPTVVATVPLSWVIVGMGDFNGDGKADLLWRGPNGEVATWTMNGSTLVTGTVISTVPLDWVIAAVGDFNGDGKADILWRAPNGAVAIWLMNGSTVMSGAILSAVPPLTYWSIAGVGDFNGDGKADILWRGAGGEVAVWIMNGSALLAGAVVSNVPSSWNVAGLADYNGDGMADILWRGPNGEVALWLMTGGSISSGIVVETVPLTWRIVGTGDYDGDGKADILWRAPDGSNPVWYMNGSNASTPVRVKGAFNIVPLVPDLNWQVQNPK